MYTIQSTYKRENCFGDVDHNGTTEQIEDMTVAKTRVFLEMRETKEPCITY
jgi:hypothetical protein